MPPASRSILQRLRSRCFLSARLYHLHAEIRYYGLQRAVSLSVRLVVYKRSARTTGQMPGLHLAICSSRIRDERLLPRGTYLWQIYHLRVQIDLHILMHRPRVHAIQRDARRRDGMPPRSNFLRASIPYIRLICPRFKDIIGETARLMNATIRCELMKGIRRGTDAGH